MTLDLLAADRGICPAYPREDDAEIVVDLRGGSDRGAWILDIDLLLNGDRRRDAFNGLHIRLAHPSKKLAGVRGRALSETPLSLGEQSVESQ